MLFQEEFEVTTSDRGSIEITEKVQGIIGRADIDNGLCHVFVAHTSASLMLCENADPTVRRDLEAFMARLVPDGDPLFQHASEGPDDMPAHLRTILTHSDLTLPVRHGSCALGTWQGIYLWEHRAHSHRRRVIVTIWS